MTHIDKVKTIIFQIKIILKLYQKKKLIKVTKIKSYKNKRNKFNIKIFLNLPIELLERRKNYISNKNN